MKEKVIVAVVAVLLVFNLKAQRSENEKDNLGGAYRVKQAEKAYDGMAYPECIRYYEPLYKNGKLTDQHKLRLASAYLKVNKSGEAESVYASVTPEALFGEHLYLYAQALRSNQKYLKADFYIAEYQKNNITDSINRQSKGVLAIKEILEEKKYLIEEVDFNSPYSDFGAIVVNDQILFTAARDADVYIKRECAWMEAPHFNVFCIHISNQESGESKLLSQKLKSKYHDGPVCVNSDATELYITRTVDGSKNEDGKHTLKLMVSYKQDNGKWGKPKDLDFNNSKYSCGHAALSKDGNRMYFTSNAEGGMGGTDIWYVDRQGSGWSSPINLGKEINTEGNEMFPFVHADGRLYFASNGHLGLGGLDIFVASHDGGTYTIQNMGSAINSEKDDFSIYINPNGTSGYFASNRAGGTGDDDIYHFKVVDPVDKAVSQNVNNR